MLQMRQAGSQAKEAAQVAVEEMEVEEEDVLEHLWTKEHFRSHLCQKSILK